MSDLKVKDTEAGSLVVLRQFLHKLQRVKKRKSLSEGQTPDSVAAKLRRHLSGKAQQQSAGS
jgi:hypothetical protein